MIPIADPDLGAAEADQVRGVIESGMVADGPEVRAFEAEFAAHCDVGHGVGTANGTAALHAALAAVGVGPGDRVVTTPFSFVSTANAIRHCGAEPVFADIDPRTYNLDPDAVEAAVRGDDRVVAVLPVHLYGLPADMDRLVGIADEYDLRLVEDAAQAHGATYDGRPVGSFGDAACFSFYPTKNMTTAEGGMVVTDREDVAARARRVVDHGRLEAGSREYGTVAGAVGYNYRMTSIAAAIGRAQLEKLPDYVERRRANAAILTERLRGSGLAVPVDPDGRRHSYHQYTVRYEDRDALEAGLEAEGVGSKVYYPLAIHEQPAYDGVDASFPAAERAAREVLSLPVHPALTPDEVDAVAEATLEVVA